MTTALPLPLPAPVLILLRHGNTFRAGETPVMVGAKTDLPLTEEGEAQAHASADFLTTALAKVPPAGIVAGPLLRTRRFAEMLSERLGTAWQVDERLRELDYGAWEGLSSALIVERFGAEGLAAWENQGIFPEDAGWNPPFAEVSSLVRSFLAERHAALTAVPPSEKPPTSIAVTSNGLLRVIYALVTGKAPGTQAKVRTGGLCALAPESGGAWSIVVWNRATPNPK